MTFLNIMDFKSSTGVDVNDYLHLRVDQSKGIDTIPDMDINITDLNKSGNALYKQFFNNGYGGITFKATIIINKTDEWTNKTKLTGQYTDINGNIVELEDSDEHTTITYGKELKITTFPRTGNDFDIYTIIIRAVSVTIVLAIGIYLIIRIK